MLRALLLIGQDAEQLLTQIPLFLGAILGFNVSFVCLTVVWIRNTDISATMRKENQR